MQLGGGGLKLAAAEACASPQATERAELEILEHVVDPGAGLFGTVAPIGVGSPVETPPARREVAAGVVVVQHSKADLLELVRALIAAGGFAGCLDGGEQQRDQDADDGNDNQQFDQGEGGTC